MLHDVGMLLAVLTHNPNLNPDPNPETDPDVNPRFSDGQRHWCYITLSL